MDAREYDRIADLLMQIRKKYEQLDPKHQTNIDHRTLILAFIDTLLEYNDKLGQDDEKGWL